MMRFVSSAISSKGGLYGVLALAAAALLLFVLVTDANNAVAQIPVDASTPTPDPAMSTSSRLTTTTATTTPEVMTKPIGSGGSHSCRLEQDGTATCWGQNDDGQSSPPEDTTFTSISVGDGHSCGLRADGRAVCWGNDDHGQSTPPSGETFTSISVGGQHSCGLRADGTAVCWGSNFYGQSAPPTTTSGTTASLIVGDNRPLQTRSIVFASISAGDVHTCGITPDGDAVCWGDTRNGRSSPPDQTFSTDSINAGKDHTCAITPDGAPACWGSNQNGQSTPPSGETLTALSAGGSHTCGLRSDGSVACWGSNANGQSTPPTSGVFTSVSAGDTHTCALRNDGVTVCWGNNAAGQAAPPATTPRATPSPTPTGSTTPVASPTPSATPGSIAERVTGLEGQVGMLTQMIRDLRDSINALIARVMRLEESGTVPPAATPTRTPTTVSGEPTATPTSTATPTVAAHCIRKIGLGWLTGTWSSASGCTSTKTPTNAEAGTRYARYYTFTLDAPSDVTVMVTSEDVSRTYVYLLEEVGNHGAIVATHASRISQRLQPGNYTIEATTYNPRAVGNFTLTLDIRPR